MKNGIMIVVVLGCLTASAIIYLNNQNDAPPNHPIQAKEQQPLPKQPVNPKLLLDDNFVPKLPKRIYPTPITIDGADLAGRVKALVLALNILDNDDRRTVGADLAALPAAAVPVMRKALESEQLSWVAIAALTKGIELIERRESGKQMTDAQEQRLAWIRKNTVIAYKEVGMRDPKWDKEVIEALELWALMLSNAPTNHEGMKERIRSLLESAVNKGCQDAVVRYCLVRQLVIMRIIPDAHISQDEFHGALNAAKLIKTSSYPHIRKAWVYGRAALQIQSSDADKLDLPVNRIPVRPDARQWLDEAFEEFKLAVVREQVPEIEASNFVDFYLDVCAAHGNARPAGLELVTPLIERVYPDNGLLTYVRGNHHIRWAWDARGNGSANTVKEMDWVKFHNRIEMARKILTQGRVDHPNNADIPAKLLIVLMVSDSDPVEVDQCIKHVMRLDPDKNEAIATVMGYLQPKWGGSWPETIAFARQCLLSGNWEGRLPYLLVGAHVQASISQASGTSETDGFHDLEYFKDDEVWKDIDLVCSTMLKWFPGDQDVLCNYAIAAAGAEKWELALKLFDQIGESPGYNYFKNNKVYYAMRTKVQKAALKPILIDPAMTTDDAKLREMLVKTSWHMEYFSPSAKVRRGGVWTFTADGRLSPLNQPNWKIENGVLETFADDMRNHNRWKFSVEHGRWENVTNSTPDDGKGAFLNPIGIK